MIMIFRPTLPYIAKTVSHMIRKKTKRAASKCNVNIITGLRISMMYYSNVSIRCIGHFDNLTTRLFETDHSRRYRHFLANSVCVCVCAISVITERNKRDIHFLKVEYDRLTLSIVTSPVVKITIWKSSTIVRQRCLLSKTNESPYIRKYIYLKSKTFSEFW